MNKNWDHSNNFHTPTLTFYAKLNSYSVKIH